MTDEGGVGRPRPNSQGRPMLKFTREARELARAMNQACGDLAMSAKFTEESRRPHIGPADLLASTGDLPIAPSTRPVSE